MKHIGLLLIALCLATAGVFGVWTARERAKTRSIRAETDSILAEIKSLGAPELQTPTLPLTPTDGWIEKYGNSEQSRVYYNLSALTAALSQHAKVINANHKTLQPTSQPKN